MTTPTTSSTTPSESAEAPVDDVSVDSAETADISIDSPADSTVDETVGAVESAAGGGVLDRVTGYLTVARLKTLLQGVWPPVLGIGGFLLLWATLAPRVDTQIGQLPGPAQVWDAAVGLYDAWQASRAEEAAFYANQEVENAARIAAGEAPVDFNFGGSPTFPDQIWTSIKTVTLGFFLGTVIAVPLGLLAGLSNTFNKAINPLVQVFKPVSPLAWLPIVQMVIAAAITSPNPIFAKAFLTSAIVVTLNSLWPTLINTSIGASSVDKDLLNVAEVLRLGWFTRLRKIVLPTAVPYIFTGMRLSLGVGWMVLIAAEMLAQNPGLGKFIWDEFQNGSSQSLSRIMVAVIVIGVIGFLLDRLMALFESFVSRNRVTS